MKGMRTARLTVIVDQELVECTRRGKAQLPSGWRGAQDAPWRIGHWILRRAMLGGVKLTELNDDWKWALDAANRNAFNVEYVGNWGPFGVAKQAGMQQNDIVVGVDGRRGVAPEPDVLDYINIKKQPDEEVELEQFRRTKTALVRYGIQ